jgi:hypothetical protein
MFLTSIVYSYELLPLFDYVEVAAPDGMLLTLWALANPNSGDLHN